MGGDVGLSVDGRGGDTVLRRFLVERLDAEDVVDVVVGEDGGGQSVGAGVAAPLADALVDRFGVALGAGVEHDQTVAGVDRVGGGDGFEVEQVVGDFVGLAVVPHAGDGVGLADGVDFTIPEAVAEVADVRHGSLPARWS